MIFVRQIALISYVQFSVLQKCISGKERECMSDMKDATNAEAAGSDVHTEI